MHEFFAVKWCNKNGAPVFSA